MLDFLVENENQRNTISCTVRESVIGPAGREYRSWRGVCTNGGVPLVARPAIDRATLMRPTQPQPSPSILHTQLTSTQVSELRSMWSTAVVTTPRERLDALDLAVERFCAAHHPAGAHEPAKLYLILAVHASADLCRQAEPHWGELDNKSKQAFESAGNGVVGLLPGLKAEWSLQWSAFVSWGPQHNELAATPPELATTDTMYPLIQCTKVNVVLAMMKHVAPHAALPLLASQQFPTGPALIESVLRRSRAFLEWQLDVFNHELKQTYSGRHSSSMGWSDHLCDIWAKVDLSGCSDEIKAAIVTAVGVFMFKTGAAMKHARRTGGPVGIDLVRSAAIARRTMRSVASADEVVLLRSQRRGYEELAQIFARHRLVLRLPVPDNVDFVWPSGSDDGASSTSDRSVNGARSSPSTGRRARWR